MPGCSRTRPSAGRRLSPAVVEHLPWRVLAAIRAFARPERRAGERPQLPLVQRSDLSGFTVGGEYLVALGRNFDAGVGIGFYQRSTAAVDRFNEFAGTGDPIVADLKLRVVPVSATFRFLPLGHSDGVVPYIGAGVGAFGWRYSESGDFVANDNRTIIHGNFAGSGWNTGPVILGGLRVPIGSVGVGGEIRWQSALGNLPSDQDFAGTKIDLGGLTYSFTINFKF